MEVIGRVNIYLFNSKDNSIFRILADCQLNGDNQIEDELKKLISNNLLINTDWVDLSLDKSYCKDGNFYIEYRTLIPYNKKYIKNDTVLEKVDHNETCRLLQILKC